MPEATLFGIPNCDSVKKARRWLDEHGVPYRFHDFHKDGLNLAILQTWLAYTDWETLLNRRSTTWRELPEKRKAGLTQESALALLLQYPTLIKRPVLSLPTQVVIGFAPSNYQALLRTR